VEFKGSIVKGEAEKSSKVVEEEDEEVILKDFW